jgi:hypothetical protein
MRRATIDDSSSGPMRIARSTPSSMAASGWSLIVMSSSTPGGVRETAGWPAPAGACRRRTRNAGAAGRAGGAGLHHFGLGLVHGGQDGPRPGIEGLAFGGQLQAARGPLQQAGTEAVLQAGHQLGQRGWRQAQAPAPQQRTRRFPRARTKAVISPARSMRLNYGLLFINVVPLLIIVFLLICNYIAGMRCCAAS